MQCGAYLARTGRRCRSPEMSIRSVASVWKCVHEAPGIGVRAGLRDGIITASTPALARPSQASNQVNVLVAALRGRCPCLSAVSPARPGERTDI